MFPSSYDLIERIASAAVPLLCLAVLGFLIHLAHMLGGKGF